MQKFISIFIIGALSCLLSSIPTTDASAAERCRIGKARYCAKYGGFRCRRKTNAVEPKAACVAWQDACFYCHSLTRACLNDQTIYSDAKARCTGCEDAWVQCMQWATARYFPNRMEPPPLPVQ